MTPREDHQRLLDLIGQSCASGARLHKACAVIGLDSRTVSALKAPRPSAGRPSGRRQAPHHRAGQQVQPG